MTTVITYGPKCSQNGPCGEGTPVVGIKGNKNPWVIGASAAWSADGSALPLLGFLDGAVDHVRISGVTRSY